MPPKEKCVHTQGLLDELKAPKHATRQDLEATVLEILPKIVGVRRQVTEFKLLAQQMDLAETDEALSKELEHFYQTFGAMEHSLEQWERRSRELVGQFRQLARYDEIFRRKAAEAGYTI